MFDRLKGIWRRVASTASVVTIERSIVIEYGNVRDMTPAEKAALDEGFREMDKAFDAMGRAFDKIGKKP